MLRGRRQRAGRFVALHARSAEGVDTPARVAVIASRRVGNAVRRNRAKRLLREAARHTAFLPGTDVVLVARPRAASQRMGAVHDELAGLADRLGVLDPGACVGRDGGPQ